MMVRCTNHALGSLFSGQPPCDGKSEIDDMRRRAFYHTHGTPSTTTQDKHRSRSRSEAHGTSPINVVSSKASSDFCCPAFCNAVATALLWISDAFAYTGGFLRVSSKVNLC